MKKINILMFLMNESIGGTATYLFTLIKYIDPHRFNILIVCNNQEFCHLARMQGFTAYTLEKAGRGRYMKAIRCLMRLIRENSINMVNIHDGGTVSFIGRIAALLTHTITINTVHIPAGEWGMRGWFAEGKEKFFEYITQSLAHKYIAVSHGRKRELIKKGIREFDIEVVQNGVDYRQFCSEQKGDFRREFFIGESVPIVALIAHLGREKGHLFFLEAAHIILSHNREILFVIVGDGYLKDDLLHKTKAMGMQEYFLFTGFRSDIPHIMSAIDIFVLPSINEGMPMVILEAMAASKPVVATNVGGIPEVVVHGETGFLVPPCNSQRLAEAIDMLLRDRQKAESFGMAGLERVKRYFSARRMARVTERVYESLLPSSRS